MSHTQGKLNFYDDRLSTGRIEIVGIGKTVARIYLSVPGEDEANARRLVACWNRLLPFSTEEVEKGIDLVELVTQRNELLEALKELVNFCSGTKTSNIAAFDKARATIEKVKA